MKKFLCTALTLVIIGGILFLSKNYILTSIGKSFVSEDKLEKADAIFILGGAEWDRGREAVKLYNEGWSKVLICSGNFVSPSFRAIDVWLKEAEVCEKLLIRNGISKDSIVMDTTSTSTFDDAMLLKSLCEKKDYKSVIVVTSKMHTARAKKMFQLTFKDSNIKIMFTGASENSVFNEQNWWRTEQGFLFVYNETLKSFYYWLKY